MNLPVWLKRLVQWRTLLELVRVFRMAYGRAPTAAETKALLHVESRHTSLASKFRAVIGRFDRQVLNTPFAVRMSSSDVVLLHREDVVLAVDSADASVSCELYPGREYEPHVRRFFKDRVKPGMVVVDVGANIGYYSMLAARLVGPSGKVFCFEPNSENSRLILLSQAKNQFHNVTLFPIAASDRQGHALFSTCIGSNGVLLSATDEALLSPSCVVVPTFRLDDLIHDHVDLIKIDTEGAEGLVLAGARSLIERCRPVVVSEFSLEMLPRVSKTSGEEYLSYFESLGYELYVIDRSGGDLVPIGRIDAFLADYSIGRLEDLAFIPK